MTSSKLVCLALEVLDGFGVAAELFFLVLRVAFGVLVGVSACVLVLLLRVFTSSVGCSVFLAALLFVFAGEEAALAGVLLLLAGFLAGVASCSSFWIVLFALDVGVAALAAVGLRFDFTLLAGVFSVFSRVVVLVRRVVGIFPSSEVTVFAIVDLLRGFREAFSGLVGDLFAPPGRGTSQGIVRSITRSPAFKSSIALPEAARVCSGASSSRIPLGASLLVYKITRWVPFPAANPASCAMRGSFQAITPSP